MFRQYLDAVTDQYRKERNPQNLGRVYYDTLSFVAPDLAAAVPDDVNPTQDTKRIRRFLSWLLKQESMQ